MAGPSRPTVAAARPGTPSTRTEKPDSCGPSEGPTAPAGQFWAHHGRSTQVCLAPAAPGRCAHITNRARLALSPRVSDRAAVDEQRTPRWAVGRRLRCSRDAPARRPAAAADAQAPIAVPRHCIAPRLAALDAASPPQARLAAGMHLARCRTLIPCTKALTRDPAPEQTPPRPHIGRPHARSRRGAASACLPGRRTAGSACASSTAS
jgi:hypothetical protein